MVLFFLINASHGAKKDNYGSMDNALLMSYDEICNLTNIETRKVIKHYEAGK